jgi:hypothetical protein
VSTFGRQASEIRKIAAIPVPELGPGAFLGALLFIAPLTAQEQESDLKLWLPTPMLKRHASPRESTAVQNLIRYRPSGTYFGRFKIGRKLIRERLETTVFSVVKQRLPDQIREYRWRYESEKAFSNGRMTVGETRSVFVSVGSKRIRL